MKTIITFEAENDKDIPNNMSIEDFENLVKKSWQIFFDMAALAVDIESTAKVISAKVEQKCNKIKFRPHRGDLVESMNEMIEVESKSELIDILRKELEKYGIFISDEAVKIEPCGFDNRINWDTYVVTSDGCVVIGYTNGDLK